MQLLPSFSAFGKVTPQKLTVAGAVAELQATLNKLDAVVEQREHSAEEAAAQIRSLEKQVEEDRAEAISARNVHTKLAALLS